MDFVERVYFTYAILKEFSRICLKVTFSNYGPSIKSFHFGPSKLDFQVWQFLCKLLLWKEKSCFIFHAYKMLLIKKICTIGKLIIKTPILNSITNISYITIVNYCVVYHFKFYFHYTIYHFKGIIQVYSYFTNQASYRKKIRNFFFNHLKPCCAPPPVT